MKKLYVLIFIIFFSISVSYGQYGMNISGAHVIVHADTYLGDAGFLQISATEGIIIKPDAYVTVGGNTTLSASRAMVIEADANGVGSLLDNGTVTSSSSGSAEVQTWVYGQGGASGVVYMHLVGPTVTDTASGYGGAGLTGVRLQQFNMTTLDTYAYEWDPSVDTTTTQPWVNVWPFPYNVIVADGLALTNYIAGTGTMYMVGTPVTGNVSYSAQYSSNNGMELISNPYPSAIDYDNFYSTNSSEIQPNYYIFNASTNGWWTRNGNTGVGDQRYLQVGQGFFVLPRSTISNPISFSNSIRVHSNDPFRDERANLLTVKVMGGDFSYEDALYIYFEDGATFEFDEEFDNKKWNSINADATMIRSIADDGTELAINALPFATLNNEMITVPMQFQCGYNGEYTFTFDGIESFDWGTEIWLEDTRIGNHWISIPREGFEYHFTAGPGEPVDRFFIHFFGPTFTPETGAGSENSLKIYASGNYAYVLNNTNETLKHVSVHNLMGKTIYEGALPQQTLNKLFVAHQTGYYMVQVETDKKIYTQKVLIFNK